MKFFIIVSFLLSTISISASAFTLLVNTPGWNTKELNIFVNSTNCSTDPVPAVKDAIELWNSVSTSGLKLKYTESTSYSLAGFTSLSYANVAGIVCDTSFGGSDSTLGLGTYAYSGGTSYGYVRLNASGGDGDVSKFTSLQQAAVVAHEIGHMLNLGHTGESDALMYYQIGTKADLSLSWDDIQGYTYLYPRDELGGDGILACGLVKGVAKPNSMSAFYFFMLMPFLLALLRRYRSRIIAFF